MDLKLATRVAALLMEFSERLRKAAARRRALYAAGAIAAATAVILLIVTPGTQHVPNHHKAPVVIQHKKPRKHHRHTKKARGRKIILANGHIQTVATRTPVSKTVHRTVLVRPIRKVTIKRPVVVHIRAPKPVQTAQPTATAAPTPEPVTPEVLKTVCTATKVLNVC